MNSEEAENRIYDLMTDACAKRLLQLTGTPLGLGDGETDEECIRGTVDHLFAAIENYYRKAIEDEPEFPGVMPNEMWEALRNDRDAMEEAFRRAVQLTKAGILERAKIFPSGNVKDKI